MKDLKEVPDDHKLDTKVRRRGSRYALTAAAAVLVALTLFAAYHLLKA